MQDDTSNPVWRQLSGPAEISAAIIDLFERRGHSDYDEVVSQNDHSRQCGALAQADGASDDIVVASFLHDVGHLLERADDGVLRTTDHHHEDLGARFLANWFGPEVTEPIRHHVAAKRYLCAVEPDYFATLSAGSVRSLELQGGPMSTDEVAAFEQIERFETAVLVRRWDDLAKKPSATTPDLAAFGDLISAVLANED